MRLWQGATSGSFSTMANGDFETKEAAFESAISAASLAIRQGHEVLVSAPGRDAGNGTALGAKDNA